MRIGISGAGGFVGKALVTRLERDGHAIIPIVRSTSGRAGEVVVGDLADPTLPGAIPPLDALIHLAARTHAAARSAPNALAAFRAVNVGGTAAMIDLAARAGAARFVFLSSVKVNGERTAGIPFTEADRPRPEDAYGQSKREAEELVRERCPTVGLDWVIVRPPLVYGTGQKGNLRALAGAVRRGLPLPFGGLHNRRTLIAVDNLADLITVVIEHPSAAGRVLMAEDGTTLSTADLVRAMARACGRGARLVPVPALWLAVLGRLTGRSDQVERLVGDLEVDGRTTRDLLGWTPPVAPKDALAAAFAPAA